jgi:predicted glycoside hydrolase/deacetylase ChbG (UPF0249 family)
MKKLLLPLLLLGLTASAQQTLQEKLGYPKTAKLLIIHADDLGVSHSEDQASFYALEKGSVSSASIMIPTPWVPEVAAYANTHPKADLGLHMTLTSEWKYLKWGPVAGKENVPHLVNSLGFLFSAVDSVIKSSGTDEVEKELRAQIERAKQFGIDFTHLDSHMGTLFANKDYLQVLIKLGKEYKVPVMLNQQILLANQGVTVLAGDVVINNIYMEYPQDYKSGTEAFYTKTIQSVQPGVNEIILHAAYDDREMQGVTIDHPDYGAAWRQADFNFFTSEKCKKLLQQNGIQVITWREIRDKLIRHQ